MKKLIGSLIYFLMGWKLENNDELTRKVHSCVLVCGPHTSNWDFVVTVGAFWKIGVPMKVFIKNSWTKPWYGFFIKAMGGIGVDRSQRHNMVEYVGDLLKNRNERLYLVNTPEGTRSFAERWKKGFYYIARAGEVPVLFAFADYKLKRAGITGYIDPQTHSLEEVLQYAEDFYANVTPKFPENFNRNIAV